MRELEHFDPQKMHFHETTEKIVDVLQQATGNEDPNFFRILLAYYFARIASTMRAQIQSHQKEPIPVNMYAINLAPSGYGKGYSCNFVESNLINLFEERFKDETLPEVSRTNMAKIATRKAVRNNTDPDAELEQIQAEFKQSGEWLSAFDSATPAALKQFRHKLLLADAGALNFEIDEIGKNLTGNADAFAKFLELYDLGTIKESLTKNTKENTRLSEVKGKTPCNMMMFGAPSRLLDGAKTEEEFYDMLIEGYARRALFGFVREVVRMRSDSAEEILKKRYNQTSTQWVEDFAEHLMTLADPSMFKRKMKMGTQEELIHIEYHMWCQDRADKLNEFEIIRKTELEHRYFKALKLAATYAFIDGRTDISETDLYNAFALTEESGKQLEKLLTRDRPWVKLAKYLGTQNRAVTQVDLAEDLPFYKGTAASKSDMLNMAIAWGYSNNVIIKKSYQEGIEFLRGESLEETDTDKLIFAFSDHLAYNYQNKVVAWDNLKDLGSVKGFHWISHHVIDGHRSEEKCKSGFNLVVIDVDGTCPLDTAQQLLKDYKAMFYTTKSHGKNGQDRYRIIFPMKYILKLDATDYKEFMQAIYDWLPFSVDDCTGQRARKWETNDGEVRYQDGELFDPVDFIPRTSKNERRKAKLMDQQSLTNLERWFINHTGEGNRSNQLIKYALLLVDNGKSLTEVEESVLALNQQIQDPLPTDEISNTIMVSAAKAYARAA